MFFSSCQKVSYCLPPSLTLASANEIGHTGILKHLKLLKHMKDLKRLPPAQMTFFVFQKLLLQSLLPYSDKKSEKCMMFTYIYIYVSQNNFIYCEVTIKAEQVFKSTL